MYTDAPLASQGSDPYGQQNTMAQPQPVPQYNQPQPTQPKRSAGDACVSCLTSKVMKIIVTLSVFVICPTLMAVIGVLGPIFLIKNKASNRFASFLFAIYTFILAGVLLMMEFRIKFMAKIFIFLMSPTWRAIFLIFLGTLSMATYEHIDKLSWVGYLIGIITIIIGVLQIIIGCLDKDWKRQQIQKYRTQGEAQGWNPAAMPQNTYAQPVSYDQQPYPALSTGSTLNSQEQYAKEIPPQQPAPPQQPSQPLESQDYNAASDEANRQLAAAAAVAVAPTIVSGGSQEDAMMAAAQDEHVRKAAGTAAAAAATKVMSSAYDRIFEDE